MESYIIGLYSEVTKVKRPYYWIKSNTIFVIMDKFIKQKYFIAYIEEILIKDIAQTYIKEVLLRYRVLAKIILNRNRRFILAFQQIFIIK